MIEIVSGVGMFIAIVLALVALILAARSKLVASGDVKIRLNGDDSKALSVPAGGKLLNVLADNKIFVSSACGGGGTCAQCKVHVHEGGGDILPTELTHITKGEARDGMRLSCQVNVKQDMEVEVPAEFFSVKKWECEVVSNYNVASFIKEFVVRLPEGETLDFEAGGYIQVDVPTTTVEYKNIDITAHPDHHPDPNTFQSEWDKFGLWDLKMVNDEPIVRAYSMANHPAEGSIIKLTSI